MFAPNLVQSGTSERSMKSFDLLILLIGMSSTYVTFVSEVMSVGCVLLFQMCTFGRHQQEAGPVYCERATTQVNNSID